MDILLDNTPKGVLTEEQRKILIDAATKWDAHYLTYATELNGIHYFLYGVYKDLAPHYGGIPFFVYFDGNKVMPAPSSIDVYLFLHLDSSVYTRQSTD